MATTRVDDRTHATLRMLASETGMPVVEVLAMAVEEFQRRYLLSAMDEGYAALRKDGEAWAEVEAGNAQWDVTIADGLEEENSETLRDLGRRS
jgi:hypothetical protein